MDCRGQASLSFTIFRSLSKFMFVASVMPSAISSSDALLCSRSFPWSGTFPMSHLFASDDPNTGTSASTPILPMNIQGWSPLTLTGLILNLSQFKQCTFAKKLNLSEEPVCAVLSRSVMPDSCNPIDCSLPGSSVRGILQARILEWVAISFSRASSQPRNQTWVSCIAGRFFTNWALWRV